MEISSINKKTNNKKIVLISINFLLKLFTHYSFELGITFVIFKNFSKLFLV